MAGLQRVLRTERSVSDRRDRHRSYLDAITRSSKFCARIGCEQDCRLVGLAHYLFHVAPATNEPLCDLSALFTSELVRGRGVGRALMNKLYEKALEAGALRVHCQTQTETDFERDLYDKFATLAKFIMYPFDDDSFRGLS